MWNWPLINCNIDSIPDGDHRGAFGKVRKYDTHTGVDLYCNPATRVIAVESGIVVSIENFTGPDAGSPWWNATKAILVEGASGVILYGEIEPEAQIKIGKPVMCGEILGTVKTVLKKDKGQPMTMLHLELYKHGTNESVWWHTDRPNNLLDPTKLLKESFAYQIQKKT